MIQIRIILARRTAKGYFDPDPDHIDNFLPHLQNDLEMDHPSQLTEIKDIKSLGEFVAKTRKKYHLTQEELAARAGVSRRFVYQLENGSRDSFPLGKVLLLLRRMNLELSIGRRKPE